MKTTASAITLACLLGMSQSSHGLGNPHPWDTVTIDRLAGNQSCALAQEGQRNWFNVDFSDQKEAYRALVSALRDGMTGVCQRRDNFLTGTYRQLGNQYSAAVAANAACGGCNSDSVTAVGAMVSQASQTLCELNNQCTMAAAMLSAVIDHPATHGAQAMQNLGEQRACGLAYFGLMRQLYCPPGNGRYSSLYNPWSTPGLAYRGVSTGRGLPNATCGAYAPISGTSQGALRLTNGWDLGAHELSSAWGGRGEFPHQLGGSGPSSQNGSFHLPHIENALRNGGLRVELMNCQAGKSNRLDFFDNGKSSASDMNPMQLEVLKRHYEVLYPATELRKLEEDMKAIDAQLPP